MGSNNSLSDDKLPFTFTSAAAISATALYTALGGDFRDFSGGFVPIESILFSEGVIASYGAVG